MVSISELDNIITRRIPQTKSRTLSYVVRKNVEYNIQYLDFLAKNYPAQTSVVQSVIVKNFLITAFSIMEGVLSYELKTQGLIDKEEWELVSSIKANPKNMLGHILRTETFVYKKIESTHDKNLSFKQKVNIAQNYKIFGKNPKVYQLLCNFKKLRDKVHIHLIDEFQETDYNRFSEAQFINIKSFFLGFLQFYFGVTQEEIRKYFQFLL